MLKKVLLILAIISIALCEPDYCRLCTNGKTHVMCLHSGDYSRACYRNTQIMYLNEIDMKFILDTHNKFRNLISSGEVLGFSPAARMPAVIWDNYLAYFAVSFLKKCVKGQDECRDHPIHGSAGQNVYEGQSPKVPQKEAIFGAAMKTWSEDKDSQRNMILETVFRIGCAAILGRNPYKGYEYKIVCNYVTVHNDTKKVYLNGSSSLCKTGQNPKFPYLCSINEPRIKYEDA